MGQADEIAELKARLAELEAAKTARVEAPKKGGVGTVIGWIFVICVGLFIAFLVLGAVASQAPATPITAAYALSGTARYASITISNESGGTAQMDVEVPWRLTFEAAPGQHLYLSAQNADPRGGTLSCSVGVNGTPLETATSSGRHTIASCSGLARAP